MASSSSAVRPASGDQRCLWEELDEPCDCRVGPRDLPDSVGAVAGGKLLAPPCSQLRDLGAEPGPPPSDKGGH